jgi:Immunoglobulin domain/NHL repeat
LYVTDFNNNTIRKVTAAGAVTTLAGWAGIWGNADGTNGNALFSGPAGISVDHSGNLYVVDSGNYTLRKITPNGTNWVVNTVSGSADVSGSVDGTSALFSAAQGVAIDNSGYLYVADAGNNTIRSQGIPPVIVMQPQSQTNLTGNSVVFTVTAYGSSPFTYTWQYNGTNFAPSGSSLLASNAGNYLVTVSNLAGFASSSTATLTLINPVLPPQPGVFQTITAQAGNVQLGLTGTTNATYTLRVSTNLLTWSNLTTFSMTNGAVLYQDLSVSNVPTRFYRLVSP